MKYERCYYSILRDGGWFLIYRLFKSILFLLIEFNYAFSITYTVLACYVYYYCIYFSPDSSQDFYYSLRRDPSRYVTLYYLVSIILLCTSFRVYESSFRQLLLWLCGNRCAEALVFYRNSFLNRLTLATFYNNIIEEFYDSSLRICW